MHLRGHVQDAALREQRTAAALQGPASPSLASDVNSQASSSDVEVDEAEEAAVLLLPQPGSQQSSVAAQQSNLEQSGREDTLR